MIRILVTLAAAVYNNVANLWPPFNRALYVPANLLAACAALVVATQVLDLSSEEIGLASSTGAGLLIGVAVGAALAGPLLVVAHTRFARSIADRRVGGLRGSALAFQTLLRVPLGTALLEELLFRGVLFGAWRDSGDVTAALVSSAAFGLWHVAPSATMVRVNVPSATPHFVARAIAGTVLVTAGAGLALVWLRVETGSLAAPFGAHAAVNSVATLAGALAGRRTYRDAS